MLTGYPDAPRVRKAPGYRYETGAGEAVYETHTMVPRLASAVVGLPILALLVWAGPPWFSVLVVIAAAVAALEMSNLARGWGDRPEPIATVALAVTLVVIGHFVAGESSRDVPAVLAIGIATGISLAWLLLRPLRGTAFSAVVTTVTAGVYVGGLLFHAPLLRELDDGLGWVFLLFIGTFATDTCAFFVGRAIGRRRLAPSISPGKTWEGSIGGVAGALGSCVAAVFLLDLDATIWEALALGALVGVVGQVGDLVESRMKRTAGAKESGWFVPGHGGILDRLDSIVFNLVVVYYFVS